MMFDRAPPVAFASVRAVRPDDYARDEITGRLLAIAAANLTPMLAMSVATAAGAAIVFFYAGADWVWAWLGVFAAVSAARYAARGRPEDRARFSADPAFARRWRRTYAAGLYASALIWIAPALFVGDLGIEARYTYVIILSALAAGGTGIMAACLTEGRVYIALMLGPPSLILFSHAPTGFVLMTLGLTFLGIMFIVHGRNHAVVRRSIELQLENGALVADLKRLNGDLETKVQRRTQALADAAHRDALTGLPNRRALISWMDHHLSPATGGRGAALFLDLDYFKQVNDALGHDLGDRVLKATAQRLQDATPANGFLARWGGDEFVLVLVARDGFPVTAEEVARDLVARISAPFVIDGAPISLGLSVGVASYPEDATDHRALVLAADLAVAEVKRNGRGQVFRYCESYAATQRRRFDLSRALKNAVAEDLVELAFQPIVTAQGGRVHAYEALARWRHPDLGWINPEEFIRVAEETDGILALGDALLRRACAAAAAWRERTGTPKVAVNVSVKQLRAPGYALRVMQILSETGLAPHRLELEVTESLFGDEAFDHICAAIDNLRGAGVTFLIDDFGAGYSSLSRLHDLPVGGVKIDKSFVADLNGKGAVVIEGAVLIARRFGIGVVAEGVETPDQAERLRQMGVDYFQGYLFGRPSAMIDRTPGETRGAA